MAAASSRRREGVALGLALLLHAVAGFWWAGPAPLPGPAAGAARPPADLLVELGAPVAAAPVEPRVGGVSAPHPPPAAAPAAATRPWSGAPERAARATPGGVRVAPAGPPTLTDAASAPGEARAAAEHGLGPEALGLGRDGTWLLPERPRGAGPTRPTARAVAGRLERSLAQGAADRDAALGLAREGAVLTALERAVQASDAPAEGRARVGVEVDARGKVTHVEVLEANGDFAAWSRAAQAARAALSGRRLVVARGMSLEVEVTSRVVLPSGHAPGADVSIAGIPLDRPRGAPAAGPAGRRPASSRRNRTRVRILEPKIALEEVEVDVPGRGKVKMLAPIIGIIPFATDADPADLGATPRRMVQARVTRRTVH